MSRKTSLIIVNYNTAEQVISCIESLQNETLNNIVVVDNASSENNIDIVQKKFPSTVILRNSENTGFGGGCNAGIRWVLHNCDSDFILILNPDTIVRAGIVDILERKLLNLDTGIVAPRITMMPETDLLWYGGGNFSWLKGSARIPGYGKSAESAIAMTERDVQFASGCAFMIKLSVVKECGGFDPGYFMYEEDVELSLRIRKSGYKIKYVPEALVHHSRQGSFSAGEKKLPMFDGRNPRLTFFVYYSVRNRFRTVFKHGNFIQKLIFIIGFILWTIRKGLGWIVNLRFDAFASLIKGAGDFNKKTEIRLDVH